ncbi:hypothetical protein O1611_g1006 [Lasiodiplodia mahajangana]|uniref:Uncharacterized protein n=1 Tax=Lasiodiplodia mahajangana TaxID=1108764 RepID=A0ACC2JYS4_9PEZI|nr:hypothetical protein O1611_g1006 [Lasiodiplodia mahajangana]
MPDDSGLELERELNFPQLADHANHALSMWLTKQLESVESSICELQATQHDSEILISVREDLRKQRNVLTTPVKLNPITEADLYQYDSVESELDGLINSLKACTPETANSHKNSRDRRFWRHLYFSRFRDRLAAAERARLQFDRVTENLESLKAVFQLVVAFQKAHLAETRSLRREVKSNKARLAYYENIHEPSRASPEETKPTETRDKLTLIITVRDVTSQTHLQLTHRNPFRDSSSTNEARHDHFRKEWLKGTCGWLIDSPEFWDEWLFGNITTPQLFYCWGPPGAGKSVITSHVIETLKDIGNICAYYYLGTGYEQSAEGLVLGLLGQLCDLRYGSSAKGLDDTIHYHVTDIASPHRVDKVATQPIVELTPNSTSGINHTDPPCHHAETRATIKSSPTVGGEFGEDDSKPSDPAADRIPPQDKTNDDRKRPPGESRDPLSTLLRALRDVCSKISSPIFIVIDAWDEANMEHHDDFLSIIQALLLSSNCRLFLTGREQPDISLSLPRPRTQLEVQHQRTYGDVRAYVKHILGNLQDSKDHVNSHSYSNPDLVEIIANLSNGSFHFAYSYATGSNSALKGVLNRRVQSQEASGLRKWAFLPISPHEASSQILNAIDVMEPKEFLQSLVLLCLLNFPVPISATALEEALPIISKLFPVVYNPKISYRDFLIVSKPIWPLISIDPGTQLIHLSSQVVIDQLRNIWYEKWAKIYPELLPQSFTKHLTIFCLQYMLDRSLKAVDFMTERSVERLVDQNPSLAFVAMSWNTHYRNFLQSMIPLSVGTCPPISPTAMGPLPRLAPDSSTELSYDQRIGAYHDSSDDSVELNFSADGVFDQVTQSSGGQRDSVINEDDGGITRLITQLASRHELLQALALLPVYLGKDYSAAMSTWHEALSWVSSMPELHILSWLGLVSTVRKGGFEISQSDANAEDNRGMTALHITAQRGIEEDVCTLLEAGAQPHTPDHSFKTAMDYAADGHRDGILACLFENFCETWSQPDSCLLNIRNLAESYGRYLKAGRETDTSHLSTALIHAANRTKIRLVHCLLNCGADPNCRDEKGIPVLHHALAKASDQESMNNTIEAYETLLFGGADPSITSPLLRL